MSRRGSSGAEDRTARNVFFTMVALAVMAVLLYLTVKPLALKSSCNPVFDVACACPSDPNDVKRRNLLIVDTTDPLRAGKVSDIEELLGTFASGSKGFVEWIRDGKKPDQTSVFLLSNVAPPDMRPIAVFCTQPPAVSIAAGNTGEKIRELQLLHSAHVTSALKKLEGGKGADQSPIVEALAILTGNASAWRPGGTIILASDLVQNTAQCGFFERLQNIPPVSRLPSTCIQEIRTLRERIRPSSTYPEATVVALCEIPGKTRKDGLLAFWREIFQEPLGYDVLLTCDPQEITSRRSQLSARVK